MTRPYKRGSLCSRCDNERRPGQRLCHACHNADEKRRQKREREDLRRLRKIIRGIPIGTLDDGRAGGARNVNLGNYLELDSK